MNDLLANLVSSTKCHKELIFSVIEESSEKSKSSWNLELPLFSHQIRTLSLIKGNFSPFINEAIAIE